MICNAISIRQPWAWLICSFKGLGPIPPKRIENRSRLKHIKGRLLIHAGDRLDMPGYDTLCRRVERFDRDTQDQFLKVLPKPGDYQRGGIVGWADFTGKFFTESDNFWFAGPNGLVIENAGAFPFHPCKGWLSIFKVDYPSTLVLYNKVTTEPSEAEIEAP